MTTTMSYVLSLMIERKREVVRASPPVDIKNQTPKHLVPHVAEYQWHVTKLKFDVW
jgi:hypothetical protein